MHKLYPGEEKTTLRYPDYGLIMEMVRGAKTVLEFGPGLSTFALIEAGVEKIVSLEHTDEWFDKAKEQFKGFPQVELRRYWDEPVARAELLPDEEFDVALVDSPKGFTKPIKGIEGVRKRHPGQADCSRFNTCLLALQHAPKVLLHDAYRPLERGTLGRLHLLGHTFVFVGGPSFPQKLRTKVGLALITRSKEWQRHDKILSTAPSIT